MLLPAPFAPRRTAQAKERNGRSSETPRRASLRASRRWTAPRRPPVSRRCATGCCAGTRSVLRRAVIPRRFAAATPSTRTRSTCSGTRWRPRRDLEIIDRSLGAGNEVADHDVLRVDRQKRLVGLSHDPAPRAYLPSALVCAALSLRSESGGSCPGCCSTSRSRESAPFAAARARGRRVLRRRDAAAAHGPRRPEYLRVRRLASSEARGRARCGAFRRGARRRPVALALCERDSRTAARCGAGETRRRSKCVYGHDSIVAGFRGLHRDALPRLSTRETR